MIRKTAASVSAVALAVLGAAPAVAWAAPDTTGAALDTTCSEVGKLGTQGPVAMTAMATEALPVGGLMQKCTDSALSVDGDAELMHALSGAPSLAGSGPLLLG
ncbi:hypothetical protein [Kitasatospora sp. NPDC002040]|uniref:hypothetical protein n=1 Tax=Kitasatospora sp. NPDC002040 TaxID=3154661 RepID=UPI003329A759